MNPIQKQVSKWLLLVVAGIVISACGGGGGGGTTPATGPTVTSTSPSDGATDVKTNAVLSMTFDKDLDATTLTSSSFSLAGASAVMGVITYDAPTRTATFTPSAPLKPGTLHTATLTTSITDSASTPLTAVFSATFTTESFIQRVNVDSAGGQANGASLNPSLSADGRYVAFESNASNLESAGDTNGASDIFRVVNGTP